MLKSWRRNNARKIAILNAGQHYYISRYASSIQAKKDEIYQHLAHSYHPIAGKDFSGAGVSGGGAEAGIDCGVLDILVA